MPTSGIPKHKPIRESCAFFISCATIRRPIPASSRSRALNRQNPLSRPLLPRPMPQVFHPATAWIGFTIRTGGLGLAGPARRGSGAVLKAQGRIEILIHKAGANIREGLAHATTQVWHTFMDIDLTSCCPRRPPLPHITTQGMARTAWRGAPALPGRRTPAPSARCTPGRCIRCSRVCRPQRCPRARRPAPPCQGRRR